MPTRSGRSGATHSGWARMSSLTSSCAQSLSKKCEVCHHRHPRHSHRPQHRRHACPRCVTDPVVASDGHSYERSAILLVINGVNRVSPLTRERLRPNVLIPNLNLKKRMLAFEEDLLRAAAIAVANATDGAQQQGSKGPVASRAPPPTGRRREHEALHKKAQSLQQQVQHAESRLKQQQRDASAAQGRLLAELDEMSRSRSQQLAAANQQVAP